MTGRSASADEKALIETRFENGYECPHGGKTFSVTTGGVLSYSKQHIAKWREYESCFLHGFSTRKTADILEIHRNTAFLWRHNICDSLKNFLAVVSLSGLVKADETYYRVLLS